MDMLFGEFTPYIFRQIRHHRDTLDIDNPRDFLDYLIMEGDQNPAFGYWSISMTIIAVYLGASDTLTNQLRWLTIYLAENPELQDRNGSLKGSLQQKLKSHNQFCKLCLLRPAL